MRWGIRAYNLEHADQRMKLCSYGDEFDVTGSHASWNEFEKSSEMICHFFKKLFMILKSWKPIIVVGLRDCRRL